MKKMRSELPTRTLLALVKCLNFACKYQRNLDMSVFFLHIQRIQCIKLHINHSEPNVELKQFLSSCSLCMLCSFNHILQNLNAYSFTPIYFVYQRPYKKQTSKYVFFLFLLNFT